MSGFRVVLLHFREGTFQHKCPTPTSWADWRPGKILKVCGALCEAVSASPAVGFDGVLEVEVRVVKPRYVMEMFGIARTPPFRR